MSQPASLKFSIIIPVYNRPQEVRELLDSLVKQTKKDFEVVIVEDGSTDKCEHIVEEFTDRLQIKYLYKDNSGPGQSRNYGFAHAAGDYGIFLDSDCVLPPDYFAIVQHTLSNNYIDAFGGPDEAHDDFTSLQKAINYAMTSFLTTGGIRGGSEKLDKFYPRSFNMGYSRLVFESTKGFSPMRFGEDIDMSIRILANGFKTRLIKEAFVYHKRRSNLRQFFKQVFNSGLARINLYKRHPQSLKVVHLAPAAFTLGLITLLVLATVQSWYFILPIAVHIGLIFIDSSIRNRSLHVGFLSVFASYTQLIGYGMGFMAGVWQRLILKKDEYAAFSKNFYK